MTFTYNPTIPNPTDAPSADVGRMQTNSSSISSILAVDHIGFNKSQGGQHLQVTFGSNNPPAVPTSIPILFTNTQDGNGNTLPGSLAQLFFYSGDTTHGQKQFLSQQTGSVLLLGGIILKWGYTTWQGQSHTFSFTQSFPNNIFSIVTTTANSGNLNATVNIVSFSVSEFVVYCPQNQSPNFTYIAIGN